MKRGDGRSHDGPGEEKGVSLGAGSSIDHRMRGQSAVLGFVLLFGMVAAVSVGILLVGSEVLTSSEQRTEIEQAEQAFVQLSQELETTSSSQDMVRATSLGLDLEQSAVRYNEDGATIRIEKESDSESFNLSALEYTTSDGTTIAYQAGGVWRDDGTGVTVVSEPNVEYKDGTLNLPLPVLTNGESFASGDVQMRATEPNRLLSGTLEENVTITIETPYYEWWTEFFQEELGSTAVNVNHNENRVIVELEAPAADNELETPESPLAIVANFEQALNIDGALSTSSGGETIGDVRSADHAEINSDVDGSVLSEGDVHVTTSTDQVTGSVVAAGDVTIDSDVHGDVIALGDVNVASSTDRIGGSIVSGGDVTLNADIDGDVFADGSIEYQWNDIGGELYATGEIVPPDENYCDWSDCSDHNPHLENLESVLEPAYGGDVDSIVTTYLDDASEQPLLDEQITGQIEGAKTSGEVFETFESGQTIGAGTHYVENVDVNPRGGPETTLTFDVGDGDVDVFVEEDIVLDANAHLRVENANSGNVVRFYSAGDFTMSGGTTVCPGTANSCPDSDRDANVLQFYGTSESTYSFQGNSVLHGIIYAPSDRDDNVAVAGGGSLELFGSIVAGGFETNGNTELTYDETLPDRYKEPPEFDEPSPPDDSEDEGEEDDESVAPVDYLHVTVYQLDVSST